MLFLFLINGNFFTIKRCSDKGNDSKKITKNVFDTRFNNANFKFSIQIFKKCFVISLATASLHGFKKVKELKFKKLNRIFKKIKIELLFSF